MAKNSRHLQDSPEAIFRRQILERLALALGLVILGGILARHFVEPLKWPQLVGVLGLVGAIMTTPFLTRRSRRATLSAAPICIVLLVMTVSAGMLNGGLQAPLVAMLPLLPIIAFCFGGGRLALSVLGGSVAITAWLYFANQNGWVREELAELPRERTEAVVLALLSLAAYIIGRVYERSRRIAEQHLVEASRLASLGVMAGGIAHEINNPLMIADSFARMLLESARKGVLRAEEVERLATHVVSSTTRMASIVSSLRVYSRDDAREALAPVRITQVVDDAFALCRQRFRNAGIELRVGAIPQDVMISARPVQISQVLLNVLNNAFDAVAERERPWVALEIEATVDVCTIRISDSGTGVPEALQHKIFIPFFTTKQVGKGVGLGLSVCASIMNEHGGDVSLDTGRPNTTFALRFPAIAQQVRAA